jgi:hypothetical protein
MKLNKIALGICILFVYAVMFYLGMMVNQMIIEDRALEISKTGCDMKDIQFVVYGK